MRRTQLLENGSLLIGNELYSQSCQEGAIIVEHLCRFNKFWVENMTVGRRNMSIIVELITPIDQLTYIRTSP